ncbi:MAG: hypothetical protein LW698_16555 [Planctomycetaceae bacterium]|nr:hypothetical protein [Planctomycetaceae bacterium]
MSELVNESGRVFVNENVSRSLVPLFQVRSTCLCGRALVLLVIPSSQSPLGALLS